jgi:hypothetical protein
MKTTDATTEAAADALRAVLADDPARAREILRSVPRHEQSRLAFAAGELRRIAWDGIYAGAEDEEARAQEHRADGLPRSMERRLATLARSGRDVVVLDDFADIARDIGLPMSWVSDRLNFLASVGALSRTSRDGRPAWQFAGDPGLMR